MGTMMFGVKVETHGQINAVRIKSKTSGAAGTKAVTVEEAIRTGAIGSR